MPGRCLILLLGIASSFPLRVAAADADVARFVDAIDWPDDPGAPGPLPDGPLENVNDTLLPVLLPDSFPRYRTLHFSGDELSYTASVSAHGAKLAISGTRVSFESADSRTAGADDESVTVQLGERAAFASFRRFGAAYVVSIECRDPGDPRCTRGDDVRTLAGRVEFFGGSTRAPSVASQETGAAAAPVPSADPDPDFAYEPPGELVPGSGEGVNSSTIHAPGLRFPVEQPRAYLNSQVWGIGGSKGKPGSWKNAANYAYPWRDTFCESRGKRVTPACPTGHGHQGVDIRPGGPTDATYWSVAAEDGRVASIGHYTVTLTGDSGNQYRYLHLEMARLAVAQGERVQRGQRIGLISNDFGGTPTPVHLHFEILQNIRGVGFRHVPPYASLVQAYATFD